MGAENTEKDIWPNKGPKWLDSLELMVNCRSYVKVKFSHNRPVQAQRVLGS